MGLKRLSDRLLKKLLFLIRKRSLTEESLFELKITPHRFLICLEVGEEISRITTYGEDGTIVLVVPKRKRGLRIYRREDNTEINIRIGVNVTRRQDKTCETGIGLEGVALRWFLVSLIGIVEGVPIQGMAAEIHFSLCGETKAITFGNVGVKRHAILNSAGLLLSNRIRKI